eukprot:CAMPEP_0180035192 /NCGR_PEP_ID=MMETSP0984-20121128/30120_1 /TAXON_ID=483367 /ORGANISM="non described non described, Strain CCMP 2436" /LENGTH=59 /DNA_ID=CAMNT_0021960999 /DNA_START=40 /DNA_END=215 /DNA_ORIENTATION=-
MPLPSSGRAHVHRKLALPVVEQLLEAANEADERSDAEHLRQVQQNARHMHTRKHRERAR